MIPLEGIGDFVDINSVVNPWQAIVVAVLIFALLIWPSMSAQRSVKRVEKTLTQNNGGSSVKDALDELKAVQRKQGVRQAKIQRAQTAQTKKLDEHIDWSEQYVKDTGDRLTALEGAPTSD